MSCVPDLPSFITEFVNELSIQLDYLQLLTPVNDKLSYANIFLPHFICEFERSIRSVYWECLAKRSSTCSEPVCQQTYSSIKLGLPSFCFTSDSDKLRNIVLDQVKSVSSILKEYLDEQCECSINQNESNTGEYENELLKKHSTLPSYSLFLHSDLDMNEDSGLHSYSNSTSVQACLDRLDDYVSWNCQKKFNDLGETMTEMTKTTTDSVDNSAINDVVANGTVDNLDPVGFEENDLRTGRVIGTNNLQSSLEGSFNGVKSSRPSHKRGHRSLRLRHSGTPESSQSEGEVLSDSDGTLSDVDQMTIKKRLIDLRLSADNGHTTNCCNGNADDATEHILSSIANSFNATDKFASCFDSNLLQSISLPDTQSVEMEIMDEWSKSNSQPDSNGVAKLAADESPQHPQLLSVVDGALSTIESAKVINNGLISNSMLSNGSPSIENDAMSQLLDELLNFCEKNCNDLLKSTRSGRILRNKNFKFFNSGKIMLTAELERKLNQIMFSSMDSVESSMKDLINCHLTTAAVDYNNKNSNLK